MIYRPGAELEVTEDTVFVAVYADPYQLWVGSTKVTPDNQDDVLGDGKVSYDPYTYTLHLDDPGLIPGVTRGNLIYGVEVPLTVTGTANFSEDTGNFSEYIYVMNGSVTLDGEFICTGSTHFGITASGITIRGGSLLVDSPDYGLYSFGAIRIENEVERIQIDVGTNRAICLPYPEYGGVILGDHLYVKECVKEDGEPGDDIQDARHVVIEHGTPVKINGVSGSFNDKIKLNYYFDIPELLLRDNGAYVTLTNERTGEDNTLYINEAECVTDKGYKFSIPLAAKEAGDTITARAFDSEGNHDSGECKRYRLHRNRCTVYPDGLFHLAGSERERKRKISRKGSKGLLPGGADLFRLLCGRSVGEQRGGRCDERDAERLHRRP